MGGEMKFRLFSKTFEVVDPIALIECYCFQTNFYANYDLLNYERGKRLENVNEIGARMNEEPLGKCKDVIEKTKRLSIFEYDLDRFLKLDDETRNGHVGEFFEKVIGELLKIKGVQLSTATKVLHTLYPEIIPMIDNLLQSAYKNELKRRRIPQQPDNIFTDYYNNLKKGDNWQNINIISKKISSNLPGLTKVRIFDILWWSYLKSDRLSQDKNISWCTIKSSFFTDELRAKP